MDSSTPALPAAANQTAGVPTASPTGSCGSEARTPENRAHRGPEALWTANLFASPNSASGRRKIMHHTRAWAAWGADFPYPSPKQGLASIPVAGSQGYYARFDNSPIYFHSFALYYVCSKENGHTASSWRARPVNWLLYRSA